MAIRTTPPTAPPMTPAWVLVTSGGGRRSQAPPTRSKVTGPQSLSE